ncbi:hypothetical protein RB595_000883 [Gaeumannomyces hyphopodioides]
MVPYRTLPAAPEPTPSIFGLNSAGIADCLSSFAVCNPCVGYGPQDENYTPMTTTASYEYDGGSQLVVVDAIPTPTALVPGRTSDYHAFVTTAAEVPGLLGCDDAALLGGYLPQYPPLHPSRPAGVEQPHTSSELMLYPGAMTATAYSGPVPGTPHLATVPPQPSSQMMVQTTQYMSSSTPAETPLPAHSGLAPMAGPGPGYGALAGYGTPNAVVGEGTTGGTEAYNGAPGLDVVVLPQRAPPAKRGPFRNQAERQKTAYTRKIGSCIRCRMQRIRCHTNPGDGNDPCGTCKKVSNTNKVWRLPCLRLKISEVVLSKTGPVKGYEWTRRWKDGMVADEISSWASDEIKTIRVTEGFTGQSVELQVRQFVPQEGDRLERSWVVDGVRRSVKIPAFALVDMDAARGSYDSYIENGIEECCSKLVNREKKLLWRTYSLAIRMLADSGLAEEEKELLLNTLELWMSIRLTTTSFEIVGNETLGMTHDLIDDTSPLNGKIPLPPVMGAQLDSILIHQIQAKFRRDTLDQLQNFTQENRQKTWLTTYLVTFVLLHNIALVIQHDASYARKHGIERRFAREDKVKQYFVAILQGPPRFWPTSITGGTPNRLPPMSRSTTCGPTRATKRQSLSCMRANTSRTMRRSGATFSRAARSKTSIILLPRCTTRTGRHATGPAEVAADQGPTRPWKEADSLSAPLHQDSKHLGPVVEPNRMCRVRCAGEMRFAPQAIIAQLQATKARAGVQFTPRG